MPGLYAFVLHYLVRNVQARDETIAAYSAVNALARDVDMAHAADATATQMWRPALVTLVEHLGGESAAVWLLDARTRKLRVAASVLRAPASAVHALDAPELVATVARTGTAAHAALNPAAGLAGGAELAVPIDQGTRAGSRNWWRCSRPAAVPTRGDEYASQSPGRPVHRIARPAGL